MEKKTLKVFLAIAFAFVVFILFPNISEANSVKKLQKAVNINEDGSAKIAEIWDVELDSGTEMYTSWTNIGDSNFQNLTVSDDRGVTYETLEQWDTKAIFSEKKDMCGINTIDDGIEICWGISEYGTRKYKVTYDITNFVKECKDSQYAYWNLFPKNFGVPVESVIIRIQSAKKFDNTNTKIWSFGYPNGNIKYSEEGYIYMDSNGKLPSTNYMTMLIKFENQEFNVTSKNNRTFQSIYDEAMKGTENDKEIGIKRAINILVIVAIIIVIIQLILIIRRIVKWAKKPIYEYGTIYEGGKRLPSMEDVEYVRDISELGCNLEEAYYILQLYNVIEEKDKSIIMGAMLLKWIKKGYISITKSKSGIFDLVKKQYCINITELVRVILDDPNEQRLRKILQLSAGNDYLLEPKEFKNYCKSNNREVIEFFKTISVKARGKFEFNKEIVEERSVSKKFIRKVIHNNTVYKESLRQKAIKLLGLKKFLLDYSQMASREAIEVKLWDDYMMYAQLLGIADTVEKQFNTIYPDYQTIIDLGETEKNTQQLISTITSSYADAGLEMAEKWEKIEEERRRKEAEKSVRGGISFTSYSNSNDRDRDYGSGGASYSGGGSGASGSSSSSSSGGGVR